MIFLHVDLVTGLGTSRSALVGHGILCHISHKHFVHQTFLDLKVLQVCAKASVFGKEMLRDGSATVELFVH